MAAFLSFFFGSRIEFAHPEYVSGWLLTLVLLSAVIVFLGYKGFCYKYAKPEPDHLHRTTRARAFVSNTLKACLCGVIALVLCIAAAGPFEPKTFTHSPEFLLYFDLSAESASNYAYKKLPGGRTTCKTLNGTIVLSDTFEMKQVETKGRNTTTKYNNGESFTVALSAVVDSDGRLKVVFPANPLTDLVNEAPPYREPGKRILTSVSASELIIDTKHAQATLVYPDGSRENRYWDGEDYRVARVLFRTDGSRTFNYDHVSHQWNGVLDGDCNTLRLTDYEGNVLTCQWSEQYKRFLPISK